MEIFDEQHIKLRRVLILSFDFARQLSYHRVLNRFRNKTKKHFNLNFWTTVYNDTIDIAVLEWCYFFKSYNDELHWKNIVNDIDSFRNGLYININLDEKEWKSYRDTIAKYRDKGIAHHELLESIKIPDMNIAFKAVCYYYRYVKNGLPNLEMYRNLPPELYDYYAKSEKQSEKILKISFESTEHMKEDSYFIF